MPIQNSLNVRKVVRYNNKSVGKYKTQNLAGETNKYLVSQGLDKLTQEAKGGHGCQAQYSTRV